MSKTNKIFEKVMSGQSDANLSFDEICTLLTKLGYTARPTKGSHIIFQRAAGFLNLQPASGGKARAIRFAKCAKS